MSTRTIIALIIVILLTVTIMQNQELADFNLLFVAVHLPKLVVMTAMSISGFILGLLVSLPRNRRRDEHYLKDEDNNSNPRPGTLSDEDRDYISEP